MRVTLSSLFTSKIVDEFINRETVIQRYRDAWMLKEFDEIYKRYAKKIYGFLYRLSRDAGLSEDLLQETFYRAIKNSESFRGDSSIDTWLCQIARNCYFDYLRKNRIQFEDIELYSERISSNGDGVEKHLIQSEMKERIFAICKLLGTRGDVFILHAVNELNYDEIGKLYDHSDVWARVTYFRAKDYIRKEMENEGYFM